MLRSSREAGRTNEKTPYGLEWGDPNDFWSLKIVRDQFIQPYINVGHTALEIGPGGGRWTRYLLSFNKVLVVDKHQEILDELGTKFRAPHLVPILNSGTDFPGLQPESVDFVFSFGVFVHLDAWIIEAYLKSLHYVVKPSANIVIQYSDMTKEAARKEPNFSKNDPATMRNMVTAAGYTILDENVTAIWHSAIMRFRKRAQEEIPGSHP